MRKLVHVIKNYYLDADNLNLMLRKQVIRTKRKGDEQYEDLQILGYYSTVEKALIGVYNDCCRDLIQSEKLELKEFIEKQQQILADVIKLGKQVDIQEVLRNGTVSR